MSYKEFYIKNKTKLKIKRIFDVVVSFILIVLLAPVMIYISYKIKKDSRGPIIYKQKRVTKFGLPFVIYKFRTMVNGADKGSNITISDDIRITEFGKKIRKYRLDELPQLFNIFIGDMSFVGTRPEVYEYVKHYNADMKKTLYMPAGVTSYASIKFKDEDKELKRYTDKGIDIKDAYIKYILPEKMKFNIQYINKFSLTKDLVIMIKTIINVLR